MKFITPVARTTVTADVCRKLTSHLIRGDWTEGDRLPPERELCRLLGVGRASLREALKAMEIMGLIEGRVGEGTFVRERSAFLAQPLLWAIAGSEGTDVREILEARLTIEVALAGFAAQRSTAEDLEKIEGSLNDMADALDAPAAFLQADVAFHLAIAEAAHNRILLNAVHLIRNLMRHWITEALRVEGVAARAVEQHRTIYKAVSGRDAKKAQAAMAEHLRAMSEPYLRSREQAKPEAEKPQKPSGD